MNRKEGIVVAAILLSSFIGGAFAAPRLFLSTQMFSQEVSFELATQELSCPLGGVPTLHFWSFTVDLSGRDVGSTLITFKIPFYGSMFKSSDLTVDLFSDVACTLGEAKSTWEKTVIVFLAGYPVSRTWRPMESGDYAILTIVPPIPNHPLQAIETWTVTSITTGR